MLLGAELGINGASLGRFEPSREGDWYGEALSSGGLFIAGFVFTAAHPPA